MENNTFNQDTLFSILSHPLRRKILQFTFEQGFITYSIISKEWKVKTGSIYHHLKTLDFLIVQKENKEYHLSEEGIRVCEWFLQSKSGRTTVNKIEAVSLGSSIFIDLMDNTSKKFVFLISAITIAGLISGLILEISYFGGFLIPMRGKYDTKVTKSLILFLFLLPMVVYYALLLLFSGKRQNMGGVMLGYLFSTVGGHIVLVTLFIVNQIELFELSLSSWFVISLLNQLTFLFINISIISDRLGMAIEKSGVILVGLLYFQLFIAIGVLI